MDMGSITVRNLDDSIKQSARLAAAKNGRSMEAEIRALLERTYAPARAGKAAQIRAMSGEDWVSELIAIAGGAGDGVFDREDQPLRDFDL